MLGAEGGEAMQVHVLLERKLSVLVRAALCLDQEEVTLGLKSGKKSIPGNHVGLLSSVSSPPVSSLHLAALLLLILYYFLVLLAFSKENTWSRHTKESLGVRGMLPGPSCCCCDPMCVFLAFPE